MTRQHFAAVIGSTVFAASLFSVASYAISKIEEGAIERCMSAYNKGVDHREALIVCRPIAEQGVSHAQNVLGEIYMYGEGIPQDFDELTLSAFDSEDKLLGQTVLDGFPSSSLAGGLGLTCHSGPPYAGDLEVGGAAVKSRNPYRWNREAQSRNPSQWRREARFGFRNWSVRGDALVEDQEELAPGGDDPAQPGIDANRITVAVVLNEGIPRELGAELDVDFETREVHDELDVR